MCFWLTCAISYRTDLSNCNQTVYETSLLHRTIIYDGRLCKKNICRTLLSNSHSVRQSDAINQSNGVSIAACRLLSPCFTRRFDCLPALRVDLLAEDRDCDRWIEASARSVNKICRRSYVIFLGRTAVICNHVFCRRAECISLLVDFLSSCLRECRTTMVFFALCMQVRAFIWRYVYTYYEL